MSGIWLLPSPLWASANLRVEAATAATGGLVASGVGSFVDGQTLWMLGRYENAAAAGADRLDLLIYDTADADAPAAAFDPADPAAEHAFTLANLDIDLTTISSILFTIRGNDNNFIDELRIGSTYASVVVPEPACVALLLVGAFAIAARAGRAAGTGSRASSGVRVSWSARVWITGWCRCGSGAPSS